MNATNNPFILNCLTAYGATNLAFLPEEQQREVVATISTEASRLKRKSCTMCALSCLIAIIAIPIIIFLGFLATFGIFAAVPDALLIPSLIGLVSGSGFGIWKLIEYIGKQISEPLAEARDLNAQIRL